MANETVGPQDGYSVTSREAQEVALEYAALGRLKF